MQIKLYNMQDELIKVNKELTDEVVVNGFLRDSANVTSPVFQYQSATGVNKNYAYIPEFNRYYYIKRITVLKNNLYEIELSIDVLKTYATQILDLTCIIARQENLYNLYLDDERFKVYSNRRVQTLEFENGFSDNPEFILTVAGGV